MAQLSKVFFPYDPLPAQDLNDMVGFMNGVADGTNLEDESVTASKTSFGGNFTTSEVNTGFTWVDGKTIYKKSVDLGSLPNSTSKSVAHGITGLESVISLYGIAKSGTVYLTLPNSDPGGVNSSIRLIVNGANVQVSTGTDRTSYTGFATINYTKS